MKAAQYADKISAINLIQPILIQIGIEIRTRTDVVLRISFNS